MKQTINFCLASLFCLACSADYSDPLPHSNGGSGHQGGSSQAGNGFGGLDSNLGGGGGLDSDAACRTIDQVATNRLQPADIVFAVDNSESMLEEAGFVQSAMETFASGMTQMGIDYRVILFSAGSDGANGICVPSPVGSGECPGDSNPPKYQRINREVGSSNPLRILLEDFSRYSSYLRPGASKHVVVISDDNATTDPTTFHAEFRTLLAGADPLFTSYRFHGVYGFTKPAICNQFSTDPCCHAGKSLTRNIGSTYEALVSLTGGQKGNLCLQANGFVPVFTQLGEQVVVESKLACEWEIPAPPEGLEFNEDQVNVEYTNPSGKQSEFGRVAAEAQCDEVEDGWYYDDPASPSKIYVCSQTCGRIQAAGDQSTMKIQFGCATKYAPPK